MKKTRTKKNGCRRKRKKMYSQGELNKLVDAICHPLAANDKRFYVVDGLLHFLIERAPLLTVRKYLRYYLPEILKEFSEKS